MLRIGDIVLELDRKPLSGAKVVPVISKPEGTDWSGKTGYVQDAAKEAGVANPKATAVLLCGMKGMAEDVKVWVQT